MPGAATSAQLVIGDILLGTTIRQVFEHGLRLDRGNTRSMQVTSACADQCFLRTKPSAKAEQSQHPRGRRGIIRLAKGSLPPEGHIAVQHCGDGGAVRGFEGRLGQTCFAVSVGLQLDLCKAVSCQQPLHQAMDWLSIARASAASTGGLLTRSRTALLQSFKSPE